MRLIVSFLFLALLIACNKKGNISGNVFWKYNEVVGNKPDAGATALLYKKGKKSVYKTQTIDVMGNFQFENIPSGKYLLVTKSKNVDEGVISLVDKILENQTRLE